MNTVNNLMFMEHNEEINSFMQLTYMTLASSGAVPLQRLENAYRGMKSVVHAGLDGQAFDSGAFRYVTARLPDCIFAVKHILFAQSESFLEERGVAPVSSWKEVFARARRRRYLFDGNDTLIAFVASKSDLDDIIPTLLALQIEWNKAHRMLRQSEFGAAEALWDDGTAASLAAALGLEGEEFGRLRKTVGGLGQLFTVMKKRQCDMYVQNYEASYCRYRKETELWWKHIQAVCPDIEKRPVYFVSSNTHSLINVLSGFAEAHAGEILAYAEKTEELSPLAKNCRDGGRKNILYYLLMKYEQSPDGIVKKTQQRRLKWEHGIGIQRISSTKTLDVPTQIIDVKRLAGHGETNETGMKLGKALVASDAMILNIDYPLGRTAYFILNKIAEHVAKIMGVYVIGKAASLFADRGDVLIPSFIADQHTRNQYFFENCIRAGDVAPFLNTDAHGIYDNQKAVTVLGTFLQNRKMLNDLLLSGITDLEMEAGPYLAAMYEITRARRYPEDATISIVTKDVELGIIHYVSDNPFTEQRLDTSLETDGIDATYASTRAVLQRICLKEAAEHGLG